MGTLLMETSPGNYSLLYSDLEHSELFEELEHEGGGYDWESVMRFAVETELPEITSEIDFDCESSMFAAYGTNKDALQKLETLMRAVINDTDKLTDLINKIPEDYWD